MPSASNPTSGTASKAMSRFPMVMVYISSRRRESARRNQQSIEDVRTLIVRRNAPDVERRLSVE
jgi:hypothetical protein